MRRPTKGKIIVAISLLLLLGASLLNAEPIYLRAGTTQFPFVIAFPIAPQTAYKANPNLPGSTIYYFTAQDKKASVAYAATIVSMPKNLGSIPKDTAQMMINQAIDNQVKKVDEALGSKGDVIESGTEPLAGYPSKYFVVERQTKPRIFGHYRTVFVDRFLFTAWASGVDTVDNRLKGAAFIQSLKIKQ
jgi:hypothetical protein